MSIFTHNWESFMNLNNRMLNIVKKTIKKNKKWKKRKKKQIKNSFFYKKTFFIEIKKQKIKNCFLYNTNRNMCVVFYVTRRAATRFLVWLCSPLHCIQTLLPLFIFYIFALFVGSSRRAFLLPQHRRLFERRLYRLPRGSGSLDRYMLIAE